MVNSAQESVARQVLDEYRVSAIGPSDAQEDTSAFEPECGLPEEVEGDTESSELGELCPNCRTQCSSADTSCPECGQELSEARSSDTAATSNNEAARVGTFGSREADFRDIFVSDRGERTAPVLDAEAASICPTCGAHYRAGFSMCSDCKVPLQLLRRFVFPETSGK